MSNQSGASSLKKPASVVSTIVVFAILSLITLLQGISGVKRGSSFIGSQIIGLFFYIGLFGLFFQKQWAKLYCSILLSTFFLLYVGTYIYRIYQTGFDVNIVFLVVISGGLLGWLCYSFTIGEASKQYYQKLKNKEEVS